MVTPSIIGPAILFGLVGGMYCGVRGVARVTGMVNVLALFLLTLSAVAVISAATEIGQSGAVGLGQALLFALVLAAIFGVLPLIACYVCGELIGRRGRRVRGTRQNDEHGA
jgi:hypothetical protein